MNNSFQDQNQRLPSEYYEVIVLLLVLILTTLPTAFNSTDRGIPGVISVMSSPIPAIRT